jgi:hypothetical protein
MIGTISFPIACTYRLYIYIYIYTHQERRQSYSSQFYIRYYVNASHRWHLLLSELCSVPSEFCSCDWTFKYGRTANKQMHSYKHQHYSTTLFSQMLFSTPFK